jgi:hypothetical protein
MTSGLPYVFVLDLDGTIIGNCSYQCQQYTMLNTLKKMGYKVPSVNTCSQAYSPQQQLVRPGLVSFMAAMKKMYSNVHFFIYTASQKDWAQQEIGWIEKQHSIRFNRPLFMRPDCIVDGSGSYRKSLDKILPRIMRALGKKAGKQFTRQEQSYIANNQLMIIDNNAVFLDRSDRLLLCPDYNFTAFEALADMVPAEAMKNPSVQQQILSLVNQGLVCPSPQGVTDRTERLASQYVWLAKQCRNVADNNTIYKTDDFWVYLAKIILKNNIRTYSSTIIQQLQKGVWNNMKRKRSSLASSVR